MYFLGDYIMNGMIEPPMTELLNNYQVPLNLDTFLHGQNTADKFFLDLRHQ